MTGEVLRVNLPKIDEHLILLDVNLSPSFLLNVEGTVDMAYASWGRVKKSLSSS